MQNQDSISKISRYLGNNVKVNLGGPESLPGRLLDVQSDYLTLGTKKDGVVYYPLQHVKAVSINSEDSSRSRASLDFHTDPNFHDVVRRFHHKKVKINRGGPESVEGVVSNVFDNHLELTVNNDILFISIYHIKSISRVGKDGRSTGNRSSGNRSTGNQRSSNRSNSRQRSRSRSSNRTSGQRSTSRRTSRNRSTSGRSSRSRRTTRTTGFVMSSGNDPRTSRIFEALAAAQQAGTDRFMYNDPTGSTGHRSSSGQSRSSHRSSRRSSRSTFSIRISRSTGSRSSRHSNRSHTSRSTGSRSRSTRTYRCSCSTGSSRSHRSDRSRSSRSTGRSSSHRSHRSRSSRSTGSSRSHNSHRHRSSSGRSSRGRSSRHHHRRHRRHRSTGNTFTWNGMTVRRGGWIKLN